MARYSVELSATGKRHIVVCVDQKDYYSQQRKVESKENDALQQSACEILDDIFEKVDANNSLEAVLAGEKKAEDEQVSSLDAISDTEQAAVASALVSKQENKKKCPGLMTKD